MGTDGTFFLDWDIDETTSRLSPGFIPQASETPPTAPNVRFTANPETTSMVQFIRSLLSGQKFNFEIREDRAQGKRPLSAGCQKRDAVMLPSRGNDEIRSGDRWRFARAALSLAISKSCLPCRIERGRGRLLR